MISQLFSRDLATLEAKTETEHKEWADDLVNYDTLEKDTKPIELLTEVNSKNC